jgi:hypothetical protein
MKHFLLTEHSAVPLISTEEKVSLHLMKEGEEYRKN